MNAIQSSHTASSRSKLCVCCVCRILCSNSPSPLRLIQSVSQPARVHTLSFGQNRCALWKSIQFPAGGHAMDSMRLLCAIDSQSASQWMTGWPDGFGSRRKRNRKKLYKYNKLYSRLLTLKLAAAASNSMAKSIAKSFESQCNEMRNLFQIRSIHYSLHTLQWTNGTSDDDAFQLILWELSREFEKSSISIRR